MNQQTSFEFEQFRTIFADVSIVIVLCLQMLRELDNVREGDLCSQGGTLVTGEGGQLLTGGRLWPPPSMHQSLVKVKEAGVVKHPAALPTCHSSTSNSGRSTGRHWRFSVGHRLGVMNTGH